MDRMRNRSPRRAGWMALVAALLCSGWLALAGTPAWAGTELHGVVNVNTATSAELEMLPGIGSARAEAVIAAREARGGFESLEDLLAVKGIGEASLDRLRPHLALEGQTTARLEETE